MITLSYGFEKPVNGDTGDVFFPALERDIQRLNDHTHDGVNSPFISAQAPASMINLFSPAVIGPVVDQNDAYFGKSLVFSQGAEQVAKGFLKIFNKFLKLSVTQGVVVFPYYGPATSQSVKFQLTTKLIKGGAAISSVANVNVASVEVLLDAPADEIRLLTIPYTDATGKINALSVENADSLVFELKRVFPTAAETPSDVIFKSDFIEVLL